MSGLRLPAEWERVGGVLMAWPHADTDWAYMIDDITKCYIRILEELTKQTTVLIIVPEISIEILQNVMSSDIIPENLQWVIEPTNDTWTRDYGPIVTTSSPDDWQINDFKFNGWGLKFAADKDNLVVSRLANGSVLMGEYRNHLGFVLEGGGIESDGKGTIMTTTRCLMNPNRNGEFSKEQIEEKLKQFLGAERILWINHGALEGDDTDSHVDTLVRFAPNDTIVYVGCDDESDSHYDELKAMEMELSGFRTPEGKSYNLLKLPLPKAIYDEEGLRLPATYANFLVVNDNVFMPTYRQPENDAKAASVLAEAFPGRNIVSIDCTELIYQHGSLHCATMQLPFEVLPLCPTPSE